MENSDNIKNKESEFERKIESAAEAFEQKAKPFAQNVESDFKKEKKFRDIVWALILIFLGTIMLLNSLGMVSWEIWFVIMRFWPVILVFSGLELIFGKYAITKYLMSIFAILVLSSIGLVAVYNSNPALLKQFYITLPESVASMIEIPIDHSASTYILSNDTYKDYSNKVIVTSLDVGTLSITDNPDLDNVVEVKSSYPEELGTPRIKDNVMDQTLLVTFDQSIKTIWNMINSSPEYEFTLGADNVPTIFLMDVGAGKGEVLLTTTTIEKMTYDVGAGSIAVNLKDDVSFEENAIIDIHVGAGKMTLEIPEEVGYHVTYNIGVGSVRVKDEEFNGLGKDVVITSDNYDTSKQKVEISVDVGLGQFRLK